MTPRRPAAYRLTASREGLQIEILHEDFWDNTIIDTKGTTWLDVHVSSVCQEIRQALYCIGCQDLIHL